MTSELLGRGVISGSADREDVDPSSTAIAFEPCRVADVLPAEFVEATFDLVAAQIAQIASPAFEGNYSPYLLRNLNAFVALGRLRRRFPAVRRHARLPQASRLAPVARGRLERSRTPEYVGDMPHSWIGAEFATAMRRMMVREEGETLELFRAVPESWWKGDGIRLRELPTAFGLLNLTARRAKSQAIVDLALSGAAAADHLSLSGGKAAPKRMEMLARSSAILS